MKAILLAIRPEWLAKILNGEKTIEVRKKFPKDYVGWVYIYCTKEDDLGCIKKIAKDKYVCGKDFDISDFNYLASGYNGKGKVVARFWCDKVEEIKPIKNEYIIYRYEFSIAEQVLSKKSCLSHNQIDAYLKGKNGFAIHIFIVEIFDKPKELNEFHTVNKYGIPQYQFGNGTCDYKKLTKAPQNYCYIEEEK